ncbi:diacylglycerol kinase [Streptomyces californicus]
MSLALQAVAGTATPLGSSPSAPATTSPGRWACPSAIRPPPDGWPRGRSGRAASAEIDLGRVGERWFGTVLASGFDSRVNDRGNRMRFVGGRFKYDLAILAELAAFRPIPYRLRFDGGEPVETEATLIAVGNGTTYGGGMRICAGGRDGRRALRRDWSARAPAPPCSRSSRGSTGAHTWTTPP